MFDHLAGFARRSHLTKGLADKQTKHSELPRSGETEREQLEREITEIKAELKTRMDDVKKTVTIRDLDQALRALNRVCTKKQLEYMIWEVDENLDECIDWDEMRIMFQRNISDRSGLEPAKLYNLVQFMIFDQDENGLVSVDETTNMLYERFGRTKMELKLKELFGSDMKETGTQGGEINFPQYLERVERTQLLTFISSPMGSAQVAKARSAKILMGSVCPPGAF